MSAWISGYAGALQADHPRHIAFLENTGLSPAQWDAIDLK